MAQSPLFDIYDPQGLLQDEYDEYGRKKRKQISDLMPEEEKAGLLRSLAEMGSSGLSTAGYILDTPGALVRGVLAGKPLSVFGSSDDRVTGRDLLRQYGMVGKDDTWGNFTGGLAAETLLDPLTYATFGLSSLLGKGAKTAASRAADAAGLMRNAALDSVDNLNPLRTAAGLPAYADEIQIPRVREYLRRQTARGQLDLIDDPVMRREARQRLFNQYRQSGLGPEALDAPLAALDEVRLPFMSRGLEIDGGRFGDWVAENADALGQWTKTAPVVGNVTRTAAALFDNSVGGLSTLDRDLNLTADVQVSKRRAKAADDIARSQLAREQTLQQIDAMNATVPAQTAAGTPIPDDLRQFNSSRLWNALGDYVESPDLPGPSLTGASRKTSGDPVADWVLENVPEFRTIRDSMHQLGPEALADAEAAGLALPRYQSRHGGDFMPRQLSWWQNERPPARPGAQVYRERPWARDQRLFSTADNFGRARDPAYDIEGGTRTFRALTGNVDPRLDSAALQQALINAPNDGVRPIIDSHFGQLGMAAPYQSTIDDLLQSADYIAAAPAAQAQMLADLNRTIDGQYVRLSDLLRSADTQFAQNRAGIFDSPSWNNAQRYRQGQATNLANANELFQQMTRRAEDVPAGTVAGGVNLSLQEASERLGFDWPNFRRRWQQEVGSDPTNYSINTRYLNALRSLMPESKLAAPERGLLGAMDSFTSAFKVGALASPAFHVRNLYSGATSSASQGAFNPLDFYAAFQASRGNYEALGRRLRNTVGYENLADDAARARQFLGETGAQRIASGNILDDVTGVPDQSVKAMFTGGDNQLTQPRNPNRRFMERLNDFFSMRGVGITQNAPAINTNPILAFNDRVGQRVEDTLRTGTFLNQIRKGVDPAVAGDLTRMAQVDYSPQAFTSFERNVMKRLMPFYSFQKGILPSIANNVIYRPGGLQNNLIRAVTRGTEPSADNFIPEYLRSSAAIPLPSGMPSIFGGSPREGLQRYLTNIDLPFESTLNMFTPGVGGTASASIADTIRKTGSNILGQTNPLLKAPLEYITNRQLYTGRQMSDLYSVLERDLGEAGRPLEQVVTNFVPFGARGLGLYRQLTDDRLSTGDKLGKAAWNLLAGAKLTDIDQERTKQLAARDMLNKLLESTPGVRTYENLTVPDEVLGGMPPEQQQMYLLYKVIQSEAAKRSRERKKAESLLGSV